MSRKIDPANGRYLIIAKVSDYWDSVYIVDLSERWNGLIGKFVYVRNAHTGEYHNVHPDWLWPEGRLNREHKFVYQTNKEPSLEDARRFIYAPFLFTKFEE